MKQLLLITFIGISICSLAQKQKVTVEEDTVKVDGVALCILEKQGNGQFNFMAKSMEGKDLMHWQFLEFNNPNKVNNSNPKGRVTYFQVTFFNDQQQCEISPGFGTKKSIAKAIVESDLVKDGAINQEAENKFVLVNGMKFSEEKKSVGGTVIIINNH